MFWVILCTIVAYVIVNLPLIYSLLHVEHASNIARLWGYAPQQFFFLVVAFPFAAFATFLGLHILFTTVGPKVTPAFVGKWFYDNWIIMLLICGILAACITCVSYFFSAMSFDKLQPQYAVRAVHAVDSLNSRFEAARLSEQRDLHREMVLRVNKEFAMLKKHLPPRGNAEATAAWLDALSDEVFIRVVQDPALQLRLGIMNPTIHALNILQLLVALFVALSTILTAVLAAYTIRSLPDGACAQPLRNATSAVFCAVAFFFVYSICYQQYRAQIEGYIGTGLTLQPQWFSGIIAVVLLVYLAALGHTKGEFDLPTFIGGRLVPILAVSVGFATESFRPSTMQVLIGNQANWGVNIMAMIAVWLVGVISVLFIWPRG